MVEVETKARCDAEEMDKKLLDLGAEFIERRLQIDSYFQPLENRNLMFRIRRISTGAYFTIKGRSPHPEGGAWPEWEQPLEDPDALERLFVTQGYPKRMTIEKDRSLYELDDFRIYIDHVEGLGEFVEAELITDDIDEGKRRIAQLYGKLGISEEEFIFKGYVKLMELRDQ